MNRICSRAKSLAVTAGTFGLVAASLGGVPNAFAQESATSQPATIETTSTAKVESAESLQFNFSGAPWGDVLRWFSEQADLSLQMDATPAGTVNFSDPSKQYSIGEGLDLINRLLLDRGWAVVRRGRMLLVVDLEAENAEKLISEMAELVTPDTFGERGNSDIVRCVFPLGGLSAEEAREELGQIIGPWGRINVLAGARQVIVTETVGKLKAIDSVMSAAAQAQSSVVEIQLVNRAAEEVLEIARPLVGLEPGVNLGEDLRISVSLYGDRLFATGSPAKLALLQSIFEKADKPIPGSENEDDVEIVKPVLKTHSVASANLQTAFDVLQTMLAGTPDTRIALDTRRGVIVASARPETQTLIGNTIMELEGDGDNFAIINLRRLEPANALLTINKFFGVTEAGGQGPTVDGDPETGRLWVRGTAQQITTVKKLIDELENDPLAGGLGENVRILPMGGSTADQTLRQLESLWPMTGRGNQLRVIVPTNTEQRINVPVSPAIDNETSWKGHHWKNNDNASSGETQFVWQIGGVIGGGANEQTPTSTSKANTAEASPDAGPVLLNEDDKANPFAGAEIVIQMTPAGLVIASKDTEALDAFEQLLNSLTSSSAMGSDLPTIFRLKFIKADVAAELVASVLGGAESSAGSLTESVMGGLGGGMLGGLLGMGGGGGEEASTSRSVLTSRGSVNIVADGHLNSLIVQATPADIDFIRMILKEIDQEESPEMVRTVPQPKLIPVIYQEASAVAEIVKSVFAEKMFKADSGKGGGGGGQPSPQDIIAAFRGGGRGGGGGGAEKPKSEATKIIVAVDDRSNSLVVTATPQDYEQVKDLVEILDQQGMEQEEQTVVMPLAGGVRPEIMQQAIESMLGVKAKTTTGGTTTSTTGSSNSGSSSSAMPTGSSPEDIQRRIEFFRSRFGGGTPGGAGGRGGGGTRGGATGGGGRGGGGGNTGGRGR